MDIETKDDFAEAFAEFAAPDDKKPADAAPAGTGDQGAAQGGSDGGAAAVVDDGSGSADAGAADGSAADGGEAQVVEADAGTGADASAVKEGDDAGAEGGEAGAAADGASDAGADAGAAAAVVADAGAASPDAILEGLRKLVGEKTAEVKVEAAAAAEAPKDIYSQDEKDFLTGYEKDWGDVSKGEALKRRAEYQQLLEHVFQQVAAFVKPIQETTEVVAERTFRTDLKASVPDYSDQLRENVVTWVKTQPDYLQVAYNHVITEGTVEEVKDLIDRYQSATGTKKPAGAGGDKKPAGKGNELSDEAKKAAAQLAPVESKRSGVQAPSDPSNFDDAWKQAAADLV